MNIVTHIDLGGNEETFDSDLSPDSNLYVAGSVERNGNQEAFVVKIGVDGNVRWSKVITGVGVEVFRTVAATRDGGCLAAGYTGTYSSPLRFGYLVVKFNAVGDLQWSKTFNTNSANGNLALRTLECSDGGFLISGDENAAGYLSSGILIKTDVFGNTKWLKKYSYGEGVDFLSVHESTDGYIVSAQYLFGNNTIYRILLTTVDKSNGNVQSIKAWSVPGLSTLHNNLSKRPGGYYMSVNLMNSPAYGGASYHGILKFDENFQLKGAFKINHQSSKNHGLSDIGVLPNGNIIGGMGGNSGGISGDMYSLSENGILSWNMKLGNQNSHQIRNADALGNDQAIFTGFIADNSAMRNILFIKTKLNDTAFQTCDLNSGDASVATLPVDVANFQFDGITDLNPATWQSIFPAVQTNPHIVPFTCPQLNQPDFSYQPDECNPLQVKFFSSDTTQQLSWNFGDGSPISNLKNPSHLFQNFGSFNIQLTVGSSCPIPLNKTIVLGIAAADIIKNSDTVICANGAVQMRTDNAVSYCWSPTTYLSNASIGNPVATPLKDITYNLTSKTVGSNLIVNGGFNAGNTGFVSGYNFGSHNITEGEYFVGPNPQAWNAALSGCGDHGSGNGNMMLVNGSPVADVKVWTQTVAVSPNTNYEFSTWIQALWTPNPAKLQFSINGIILGDVITASLPTCTWTRYNTNWNSGALTTAIISIVNKNTEIQGNDFALDDISFAPITYKKDSFKIVVESPFVKTNNDTSICLGESVPLNTTGAQTYSWQPPTGLSNTSISNPVAKPSTTTSFVVIGKTALGCTSKDTVLITVNSQSAGPKDFSYQQDICNPLSMQFISSANNAPFWDFGDGSVVVQQQAPFHLYKKIGVYIIKMWLTASVCQTGDTLSKSVAVTILNNNIIGSPDTIICKDGSVQLRSTPAVEYCWSPSSYLDNPSVGNPVAKPLQNTTYYLTSKVVGANLVTNGDFSSGNSGFTSDYDHADIGVTAGRYLVDKSPASYWTNAPVCTDHTTSTGNMMLVNGASVPGVKVWTQTINVSPNTMYEFSCWVENISRVQFNLCKLQFSINGSVLSFPFRSDSTACVWKRFFANWSSGNITTATISIVNQSTDFDGNDFALDDISFAPISIKQDSIKITIDKPVVKTGSDTTVCPGTNVQLNASGAVSYSWSPGTGLSGTTIQNPVANITKKTDYIVTGINSSGCTAKDTVTISTLPLPIVTVSPDTTICDKGLVQLNSSGGISYKWTPVISLNNPAIPNPLASPSVSTFYKVVVTGANGCDASDSLLVKVAQPPPMTISNDTSVCSGTSAQLLASGGISYKWLPALGLTNPDISNPKAAPGNDTKYIVQVKNADGCSSTDSVFVSLLPQPVIAVSNDTSICREGAATLSASGAVSYIWSPSTGLNNNSIPNPAAQPLSNTIYTVTGTDGNGCKASAIVKVSLHPWPAVSLQNDTAICSNSSVVLRASGGISYTWSPSAGLSDPVSSAPVASPQADIKYIVQVTDANGCSSRDSVLVSIRPPAQFGVRLSSFTVCLGEVVQLEAFGGDKYSWAPTTGLADPVIANPVLKPQVTGTYTVTVKESICNTQADFPISVTVVPSIPIVVTKSNDITCNTPFATLNAGTSGVKYSWLPITGLSDPAIANPVASPVANAKYTVVVTNASGCISNGSVDVKVINNADFRLYQLPNAFTPNGDGNNDCFGVSKWGAVSIVYFEIFNRWGQLVFDGSSTRQCWDGIVNGQKQPSGNYIYKMKVQTMCGEVERKGSVMLIR